MTIPFGCVIANKNTNQCNNNQLAITIINKNKMDSPNHLPEKFVMSCLMNIV